MARCGCSSAAASVGVADTPSVDLSLLNGVIRGDVKIDPGPDNLLKLLANGLSVSCPDIAACAGGAADVGVLDSPGIDFTTSGAGTQASPRLISGDTKAVYFQTVAATFTHSIAAANGVYEEITELPDLVLTVPGLYIVTMDVVGNATIPSVAGAGAAMAASVSAQLRKDGVLVPNTETRLANNSQGATTTTEPALRIDVSGSATRAVTSDGTAALTIWAARNSGAGASSQVISDTGGRTRITAWRIGA